MADSPERIRVPRFWTCREAVSGSQEYVRADLYAALEAKLAEARLHIRKQAEDIMTLGSLVYETPEGDEPPVAWKDKAARLTEALQKAEADAARMREALREAAAALDQAREDVACWGSYAGEYFQDKHDLEGDLDRLAKQASAARRVLEGSK